MSTAEGRASGCTGSDKPGVWTRPETRRGPALGVTSRPATCTQADPGEAGRRGHRWGNDLHWCFLLNFFRSNFWIDLTVLCIQTDKNGRHCSMGLFLFSDSSPHTLCLNCQQQDCGAFGLPEGHPSSLAVHLEGSQLGHCAQAHLGGLGVELAAAAAPGWVRTLLLNTRGTQRVCHQKRFIFIRT